MKKTCRSDWENEETRASCQTEGGPPLTSHQTSISYSNAHCAICNDDFDASTDHLWPVEYKCYDDDYNTYVASITSRDHNTTEVQLSFWNISHSDSVNHTFPVDVFSFLHLYKGSLGRLFELILLIKYKSHSNEDFNERKEYYQQGEINITQFPGSEYSSYNCKMLPFDIDESIMRRCSDVISTCASDWSDSDVEAMCFAYTDYYCNGTDYFRNPHCALCNHVDLYETQDCTGFLTFSDFSLIWIPRYEDGHSFGLLNFSRHVGSISVVHQDVPMYRLLDWNQFGDMKSDSDEQNSNIIREANDGKLIFSYECY
jgi:hypothetical protein